MELFKISISSLLSFVALFLSVKLIGNRQMSELNMFDYINGITIGSIGAEMATSLEKDFLKPLCAIAIYTALVFFLSLITTKSIKARRFLNGKTTPLICNGKFLPENFKKAKIDLNEFLNQCRVQGFFNIDDINYAFLEANGKISCLPKSHARPLTPKDMGIFVPEDFPFFTIIQDGNILYKNLSAAGFNKEWLKNKLSEHSVGSVSDVFFASADTNGTFYVFRKNHTKKDNDIFQ